MKPDFRKLMSHSGLRYAIIVVFISAGPAYTQTQPVYQDQANTSTYLEYRFSEPLFGVFAWLNTGAYLQCDTSKLNEKAMMISRIMEARLTPEEKEILIEDYDSLKAKYGWMLGYVATVVAINFSDPPDMMIKAQEIIAWDKLNGKKSTWILNRLEEWAEFLPRINEFWMTTGLREISERIKLGSDSIGHAYLSQADNMINRSLRYLRIQTTEFLQDDMGILIVNMIGPEGEMGPECCGVRYDIKGPTSKTEFRPHEFIHSLTNKFTKDTLYTHQIKSIVELYREDFTGTRGASSYPDPVIFFDECLVRTIDHLVFSGWETPYMRGQAYNGLTGDYNNGFVLVSDIYDELSNYEASKLTFEDYFTILLENLKRSASGE